VAPHIQLAQSITEMDWSKLELVVFAGDSTEAEGWVCLPEDNKLVKVSVSKQGGASVLNGSPWLEKSIGVSVQRPMRKSGTRCRPKRRC
jgi:alpha-D-xyloside xylohydrolase